jgi:hypothetical protein
LIWAERAVAASFKGQASSRRLSRTNRS